MPKTLIETISDKEHLRSAWDQIKKNPTSKGIDNVTISDFAADLTDQLDKIRELLNKQLYRFELLRPSPIPKKSGGIRPLRIPIIRDRVVQKSIAMAIENTLDQHHHLDNGVSFAYIKKKSVFDAVKQILAHHNTGLQWIYKTDIVSFFERIDITKLLDEKVFPILRDNTINFYIQDALKSEVANKEWLQKNNWINDYTSTGLPQGGILSPLFANVYLADFDQKVIAANMKMIRYADDLMILCESQETAEQANTLCENLVHDLGLEIHERADDGDAEKKGTFIQKFDDGFNFLGIRFDHDKTYPASTAYAKQSEKILEARSNKKNLIEAIFYLKSQKRARFIVEL